jgi:hypothetical protein
MRPREMEFLYGLDRLNVARLRAQAVVIVGGTSVFWNPSAAARGKCSWRMHFAGT